MRIVRGLSHALLVATALVNASAPVRAEDARSAVEWQAIARTTLDEVHRLIGTAHPGAIDERNPDFRSWMETGYSEARHLLPRVNSFSTFVAVVRYYVAGFGDGHLFLSETGRPDEPVMFVGWVVHRRDGEFVVTASARNWSTPLPPMGARLLACDGRSPQSIYESDVAAFMDRRDDDRVRDLLAPFIGARTATLAPPLGRCTFQHRSSAPVTFDMHYQAVPLITALSLFNEGDLAKRAENGIDRLGDVLWLRLARLALDAQGVASLKAMLVDAGKPPAVSSIVFDLRGNSGGDSGIGDLVFQTLTGGLEYDERAVEGRPKAYALWRVSDVSVRKSMLDLQQVATSFGKDSPRYVEMVAFHDALVAAKERGDDWIRQGDGDPSLTREDVRRGGGKLRSFDGRLAVVTDAACVSACLDFVDAVRLVPSALHLGKTTSFDSVYVDVARVNLVGGVALVLPIKVWRNRARGNDEALVPDRVFEGDTDDDSALRAWVLRVMREAVTARGQAPS